MIEGPSHNTLFVLTKRPARIHTNGHAGTSYVCHTVEMWLNTYHEGVWGSTDPLVLKPSLIGSGVIFMLWLLYFRYRLGRCSGHGAEKIRSALGSGSPLLMCYFADWVHRQLLRKGSVYCTHFHLYYFKRAGRQKSFRYGGYFRKEARPACWCCCWLCNKTVLQCLHAYCKFNVDGVVPKQWNRERRKDMIEHDGVLSLVN